MFTLCIGHMGHIQKHACGASNQRSKNINSPKNIACADSLNQRILWNTSEFCQKLSYWEVCTNIYEIAMCKSNFNIATPNSIFQYGFKHN